VGRKAKCAPKKKAQEEGLEDSISSPTEMPVRDPAEEPEPTSPYDDIVEGVAVGKDGIAIAFQEEGPGGPITWSDRPRTPSRKIGKPPQPEKDRGRREHRERGERPEGKASRQKGKVTEDFHDFHEEADRKVERRRKRKAWSAERADQQTPVRERPELVEVDTSGAYHTWPRSWKVDSGAGDLAGFRAEFWEIWERNNERFVESRRLASLERI
jgi:hypothetical protein